MSGARTHSARRLLRGIRRPVWQEESEQIPLASSPANQQHPQGTDKGGEPRAHRVSAREASRRLRASVSPPCARTQQGEHARASRLT